MENGIRNTGYSLRRKKIAKTVKPQRLMGIAGAGRGTGVTHFCILTANYLSNCLQRKTALIQWNDHGAFEQVGRILARTDPNSLHPFSEAFQLMETDYFTRGDAQVLARCIDRSYDDIIIDFGELRKEIHAEWLRCSTKCVVASLNDWKLEAFLEFLSGEEKLGDGWIYAAAFGSRRTQHDIERQFHISLSRIPFSEDAFSIDRNMMSWFKEILK